MNTSECPLCSAQSENVLWRDDQLRVILVDDASYGGFCRVILHRHAKEMTDLAPTERTHMLRAVFAVEKRRQEQKYEALQATRNEDAAELGRRAGALAEIGAAAGTLRAEVLQHEQKLAQSQRLLAEAQNEASALNVALYDSEGLRERREDVLRGLQNAHQILQITSGQQQVALYELESRYKRTDAATAR